MKLPSSFAVPLVAGLAAASASFIATAVAQGAPADTAAVELKTAVFAGGCFWCVESDFDKVDGVVATISGYTGGTVANPTYKQVTYKDTGHYEAVEVTYDPSVVSYGELVSFFFRHIDPTDADGQFCDTGDSYRTAVFVGSLEERAVARDEVTEIDQSGRFDEPIVTEVLDLGTFYLAEDYHQDYYLKNPVKYQYYRTACGRDKTVKALWGEAES
ncbi:MAG: peptide-methionine (S)-S-oxide reductase MsrA [Pseudomonadota bacterium]